MRAAWKQFASLTLVLAGLAVCGWQTGQGTADERAAKEKLPIDLAQVPGKAAGFLSVRVADLWMSPLGKGIQTKLDKEALEQIEMFQKKADLRIADLERVTFVFPEINQQPLMFFATSKAADPEKVFAILVPGGKQEKYAGQTYVANKQNQAGWMLGEKAFVSGPRGDIQTLLDNKPAKKEPRLPALSLAAKKHSVVIGVSARVIERLKKEFTETSKLGPFGPLLEAKQMTAVIDVGSKTTAKARAAFEDEAKAREGEKAVRAGQKLAEKGLVGAIKELAEDKKAEGIVALLKRLERGVKGTALERDKDSVSAAVEVALDEKMAGAATLAMVQRIRQSAARAQSVNNLKQIGIAMHNYLDNNKTFPPQAIYDKDGKALLSWRVLLLPYLEQDDLYKQFKLNEAWDSPHNKKLLAKMPSLFQAPGGKPANPFGTFYQGFTGKGAFFEGKRGIGILDIQDGTSNTIMVVEAAKDVPWSKPEDIPFTPGKLLPKVGGVFPAMGFNAAICDGSVRFFSKKIKESTLRAYITRNGGEVIPQDD